MSDKKDNNKLVQSKYIIYNGIRDDKNPNYINLYAFIRKFKLEYRQQDEFDVNKSKVKEVANICDIGKNKTRYLIPDDKIPIFMELLNNCYESNLKLHFTEMQTNNIENDIGSGIMLDFDILQEHDIDHLANAKMTDILFEILEIILSVIDMTEVNGGNTKLHICVIKKPKLVFIEEENKYKNGMHILIPGIKILRPVKKFIFDKLIKSKEIKDIFLEGHMDYELKDIIDPNSVSVPTHFIGNCKYKEGSIPYNVFGVYEATIKNSMVRGQISEFKQYETLFKNILYEFSLNFEDSEGQVKKSFYKHKYELDNEINIYNSYHKNTNFDLELENIQNDIRLVGCYMPDMAYYKDLIDLLSEERLKDRNTWRNVVYALANTNKEFKSLAMYASKRIPEKWDLSYFESIWRDAVDTRVANESKLTARSIIYWAKQDNPSQFELMQTKSIHQMIKDDAFHTIIQGNLHHTQYAKYIHHMFKHKFMADVVKDKYVWYEFVTNRDDPREGEIYKWREEGGNPESLLRYLSDKLPIILAEIILEIDYNIEYNKDKDSNLVDYYMAIKKNIIKSTRALFDDSTKRKIVHESDKLFRKRGFISDLNKDQDIMGVGNGVLYLNKEPKLINTYHQYFISTGTKIDYMEYDPENKYIKIIYNCIRELFPDDEGDAFEFLLYYLASCLDGRPKESLIFILTGSGCHAIDTEIMMFDKTTKLVQDVEIGDLVMGDDYTSRTVQRLARGRDQMVRIKPMSSDKPFIVNMNHMLSLKYSELTTINTIAYNHHEVFWQEHNGNLEPTMHSRVFNNLVLAHHFIKNLDNLVKDGDIIDIKVIDLLKWSDISSLHLYKYNFKYNFEIELLEEDNYYGFELDKNHRYLTGDHIVHHNCNGKSFLVELITSVLGSHYGKKMPMSFLVNQDRGKSSGADPCLMDLEFARLAYYSETNKNEVLNTAKLKEITGQETLSGRNLFESQRNFRPTCHHLVTTNHGFSIKTTEHGTWRRILTYEFKIKFTLNPDPDNKNEKLIDPKVGRDYAFDNNIKKALLSILVEYYTKLMNNYNGCILNVPKPTIDKETAIYRNKEDVLNRFIDEKIVISKPKTETRINTICDIYRSWHNNSLGNKVDYSNDELIANFQSSKISKYFTTIHGVLHTMGIRFLDENDNVEAGETLLRDLKK